MNKKLLLSIGLVLLLAAGLRAAPANVNFSSERGRPFRLIFDGRPLTRGDARQVHIGQLLPGYHWAEFVLPSGYGRFYNFRTRVFLDPGLETTFVLVTRPGYPPRLRKVAEVPLYPGYRGPDYPGAPRDNGGYHREDDDDHDHDYRSGRDGDYDDDDRGRYQQPGGYDGAPNATDGYGNRYPGASSRYRVMAPQDVEQLAQDLQRTSSDSHRLPLAKQALDQVYVQADDLRHLLTTLELEASRVELAKYAYPRVADRQNFYRVYDAFQFRSSVQEVQQAVGR